MSISFDGHIPRLNISTPSLCIALYKMFGKSPETEADHKKLLVCCAPTYPPKTGPTQKNLLPFRRFFFFGNFFSNFVNKKYF